MKVFMSNSTAHNYTFGDVSGGGPISTGSPSYLLRLINKQCTEVTAPVKFTQVTDSF